MRRERIRFVRSENDNALVAFWHPARMPNEENLLLRPLPRDISWRLVIEETTVYESHVGNARWIPIEPPEKPPEKAQVQMLNDVRNPSPRLDSTRRGWNTGWRDTAWRTSRVTRGPFVGNSPRGTWREVSWKDVTIESGSENFIKRKRDVEKDTAISKLDYAVPKPITLSCDILCARRKIAIFNDWFLLLAPITNYDITQNLHSFFLYVLRTSSYEARVRRIINVSLLLQATRVSERTYVRMQFVEIDD